MQPKRIIHSWKLLLSLLLLFSVVLLATGRKNKWFGKLPQQAQYDAREELRHLYNHYMPATTDFDIGGKITLYDMEQKNAVKEWSMFRNVKQGGNYYSSMAGQQTFLWNGVWMQVDSAQHSVVVAAVNSAVEAVPAGNNGFPFDRYLGDTAMLRIQVTVTGDDKERVLHLRNELTPEIKSVAVYYNPAGYIIHRMEVQWWKAPPSLQAQKENACWLSVIQMANIGKQPFSINGEMAKVIQPVNNEWKTTEEYKHYELTVTSDNAVTYP